MKTGAFFLAALLFLELSAPAFAGTTQIQGEKCIEISGDMTPNQTRERAIQEAYLEALKSKKVLIESQYDELTGSKDGKNYQNVHRSLSLSVTGYVENAKEPVIREEGKKICAKVSAEVDLVKMEEMINLSRGYDKKYDEEFRDLIGKYDAKKAKLDAESEGIQKEIKGTTDIITKISNDKAALEKTLAGLQVSIEKAEKKVSNAKRSQDDSPDDPELTAKYQKESKILAELNSQKEITLKGIGEDDRKLDEANKTIANKKSGMQAKYDTELTPLRDALLNHVRFTSISVLASSDKPGSIKEDEIISKMVTDEALEWAKTMAVRSMQSRVNALPPDVKSYAGFSSKEEDLNASLYLDSMIRLKDGAETKEVNFNQTERGAKVGIFSTTVKATYKWKETGEAKKDAAVAPTLVRQQPSQSSIEEDLQKDMKAGHQKAADLAAQAPPEEKKGSSWWKWTLGILLVAGAAAALGGGAGSTSGGGGGGGGGGGSSPSVTVGW